MTLTRERITVGGRIELKVLGESLANRVMGYEFRLAKSEDVDEALAFEWGRVGPVDPKCEELKQRIASALVAANPKLSVFQIPYERIAAVQKITIEEARSRYRYVELNCPAQGNGIQIVLFDYSAVVRIPLWHGGVAAGPVFEEVLEYLRIICRETGYKIFDPQTEKELKLSDALDESLTCYQKTCAGRWPLWPTPPGKLFDRENASLKHLFKSKKRKP